MIFPFFEIFLGKKFFLFLFPLYVTKKRFELDIATSIICIHKLVIKLLDITATPVAWIPTAYNRFHGGLERRVRIQTARTVSTQRAGKRHETQKYDHA